MTPYVGRLAPSPTGALHLGNVRTFMIAWLRARSQGGKVILRMEDLDHPKDKPGAAAAALDDLRWLGFDWDEAYVQSERKEFYRAALERLVSPPDQANANRQLPIANRPVEQPSNLPIEQSEQSDNRTIPRVYPCVCSRRDVETAQSAPHSGEQLFYPGTCRGRFASWDAAAAAIAPRTPCWRFRVPDATVVSFRDVFAGAYSQDVSATLGDFPVSRDRFGAGYTLAVVVDDAAMGVTEVVRGDDLVAATPAQILLQRALGLPTPAYCHVPLVVGPDGRRLAKRHGDTRVSSYRAAGRRPEEILGFLASSCGWCAHGERPTLRDLIPAFRLETVSHAPLVIRDGSLT